MTVHWRPSSTLPRAKARALSCASQNVRTFELVLVIVGNGKTFGPVAPMAIGDAHNPCPRALVTVIGERDAGRDGGEVVWLLAN